MSMKRSSPSTMDEICSRDWGSMRQRKLCPYSLLPFLLTLVTISFASSNMILTPNRPLGDGETLISAGGTFELGFFSPGSSTRRYLGIWYKHIPVQTVVWVANRDCPLAGRSGLLHLTPTGNLAIIDAGATKGSTIWASDPEHPSFAPNPVLELLDSGNLIVRDRSDHARARIAWQTFHHPTDTWLPGMRFSSRFELGLTSWRDGDDPAQGDYTVRLDDRGLPQLLLLRRSEPLYSTGAWNGLRLSGVPETPSYTGMFSYAFFSDGNATYYEHQLNDPSLVTRLVLDRDGVLQRYLWVNRTGSWNVYWSAPRDQCDVYGACGPYGVCSTDGSPPCRCLDGFERRPGGGCRRRTGLGCGDRDGFRRVAGLKLPDTKEAMVNRSMGLGECREACAADCECVAYTSANISGEGSGCVMWVQDLMDLRQFARGGQDLFVRLAASELVADDNTNSDGQSNGSVGKIKLVIIIAIIVSVSFFLLTTCLFLMWRRKLQGKEKIEPSDSLSLLNFGSHANLFTDGSLTSEDRYKNAELLVFSFATINGATDEFSIQNKLGEGGFGPVYKGKLYNGQEVAVKRLSSNSGQGLEEFKNEVTLIARLQHRNLVRLLGFCIQGEEKMLVYEYMHNNSLDSIIFDSSKASILDWDKRIRIIDGIAQGLLYLHKYSRLRVIHRDLKASNILLDNEMNPKISDFGMARIFGGNQNEGNTRRVVGTYGYMPPEYAIRGIFSEKSDVFSFGVLLLEIISGKKNVGFRQDDSWNLLAYAWELSKDGRAMELIDPVLGESYSKVELLNCIHIGLLCVQQSAEDRPTMSSIISLLSGSNKNLPPIKQPAFYTTNDWAIKNLDSDKAGSGSSNELTITLIDAR